MDLNYLLGIALLIVLSIFRLKIITHFNVTNFTYIKKQNLLPITLICKNQKLSCSTYAFNSQLISI